MCEGQSHYLQYCHRQVTLCVIRKLSKPWRASQWAATLPRPLFQFLSPGSCLLFLPWLPISCDWDGSDCQINPFLSELLLIVVFITVIESKLGHALPFVLDSTKNSKKLMKKDGERNWGQGSCRPLEFTDMNTFRKAIPRPKYFIYRS